MIIDSISKWMKLN